MEKVIFDTQIIRNIDANQFLGGREDLEKFIEVVEVIIPDIVIDEIKYQKKRNLNSKKTSFLANPFHWLKNLDHDETKMFDIDQLIEDLEKNETIKYKTISLTNYSIIEDMRELALGYKPPFSKVTKDDSKNSDKGFKDAYFYFTVLEYLQTISDKNIFVCCRDGRLKEALNKHADITVIETYQEFINHNISKYTTEYFINKFKTDIDTSITKESIKKFWININDNDCLQIDINNSTYTIELDSGEIVSSTDKNNYLSSIDRLVISGSFATTHDVIDSLNSYIQFLSNDEIIRIMQAVKDNEQIHWIISDDDVKQFVATLYDGKKDILSNELEESIRELLE